MECPECRKGTLKVTNTYNSGERAKFQRVECTHCHASGTSQVILLTMNPGKGESAQVLAKKAEKETLPGSGGG